MKDAIVVIGTVLGALVGLTLLGMLIAAIFPVLVALGFIVLIYWMIAKCLTGGFSPWKK